MKKNTVVVGLLIEFLCLAAGAYGQNTFPASGNVGIGTTAPSVRLQVSGAVAIQGPAGYPTSGYGFEFVPSAVAGVDSIQTYNRDTSAWRELRLLASAIVFFTNASERLRIDASGNIGVGGIAPQVKFDFGTSSNNVSQILNLYTNGYARTGFGMDTATGGMRIYAPAVGGNFVGIGSVSFDASQTWTERMRVDTVTGNVGIGTAAPDGLLALQAPGEAALHINSVSSTPVIRLKKAGVNKWGLLGEYPASGNLSFYSYDLNDHVMVLNSAGKVGIGTPNPGQKLSVVGDISATASVYASTIETYSGDLKIGSGSTSNSIIFKIGASEQMRVNTAGNVGIGTTNPTQKLSVNGTVRAKEVIVDTGWSDYVFKPGYRLASLSEVEGVIQREGHLPGVPSAAEVAKQGVSVGQMEATLLAKLEEVTLHLIRLEKENAELRARVQSLESKSPTH